jgi:transcriptional regulator with XRE-family HTH domain
MSEKVPNLKLRNARTRNNWKQQDVADRIGTTSLSVGRWERGEAFPSAYYRKLLCDLFRMSPEELGFTEEEHVSQPFDKKDTEIDEADKETRQHILDDMTIPGQRKDKRSRPFILWHRTCSSRYKWCDHLCHISCPSVSNETWRWVD